MMFTSFLHLVPGVRTGGAETLLPMYAFMGSAGQLYFQPFTHALKNFTVKIFND
jgi:hypothetical protein